MAEDHPQIRELIEAHAFVAAKTLEHLDFCFKLIGARPVIVKARLHHEVFVEELRKHLAEIKSPIARHIFFLAKLAHLNHIRIGEIEALLAADVTGHQAVAVLLEGARPLEWPPQSALGSWPDESSNSRYSSASSQ